MSKFHYLVPSYSYHLYLLALQVYGVLTTDWLVLVVVREECKSQLCS